MQQPLTYAYFLYLRASPLLKVYVCMLSLPQVTKAILRLSEIESNPPKVESIFRHTTKVVRNHSARSFYEVIGNFYFQQRKRGPNSVQVHPSLPSLDFFDHYLLCLLRFHCFVPICLSPVCPFHRMLEQCAAGREMRIH